MTDSLGYFQSLLKNDISPDDTMSFDILATSQAPLSLSEPSIACCDPLNSNSHVNRSVDLDSSIQQVDNEIQSSSDDLSEDLEGEDLDDKLDGEIEVEHDGGLASTVAAIQVEKNQHIEGEFVNNPMTFNTDKSWLEAYEITDLTNERQYATHGPANANGSWKGLIFPDKDFMRALEEWHVTHFVQMKVKKSDVARYTCVCVDDKCRWRLHAYRPKGTTYFLVSQYNRSHNCVISIGHSMHRNCTSALVCDKILPLMRASLSMSIKDIQLKIKDVWKTDISYDLAWKARSRVLKIIYDSWEKSFCDLPRYLLMMQASNPGTIWTMNPPCCGSVAQKFRRVFWAFGPSIEGWKNCRPVVSVDDTHLYGKYEGNALIATSIDGNGGLYPIAFAICEKENGENWEWFLQSLKDFVTRERKVCIISDRFSGNKELVRRVYSPSDGHAHRWCLRHIKANLKKAGIINKVVLDTFYSMGCANEVVDFNRLKDKLKVECEDAWQWVEDHIKDDCEYWALAFDGGRRYGVMTTNWSESLNSVLRGTRSLPITTFIAATFYRVNQAFVERSEAGRKMTTQLCPKILDKVCPRQLASRGYQVCRFGPCEYEVNTGTSTYSVTINKRLSECMCQTFRLTGLPCSHMLACCGDKWHRTDFHTLCDGWYSTESYRNTYSVQFHPIPDERFWPSHEGPTMLPPSLRKKKGRPKSTRIRNSMDVRETIDTRKRKCQHCNEVGHYKKRCPQLCKNSNQAQQVRGVPTST